MNKKLLLILGVSLSYFGANAQETVLRADTTVTEKVDSRRVILNRFKDNWFIQAGAGVQHYFGDHNRQAKFTEILTPFYGFNVGRWFSPSIGLRAGINGYQINGLTQNKDISTGEVYDASQNLYKQEFKYWNVSADFLVNAINLFAGYNPNRIYDISPYAGLGWMVGTDQQKEREVAANVGILQSVRLVGGLDLHLDVRGALINDRFDGDIGGRKNDGQLSALLGLTYKFKQRTWERPKNTTTVIKYDEAELAALIKRVNDLANDNEELRKLLANAEGKTVTDIVVKHKTLAVPVMVTFELNKSELRKETRVNLGFFAKVILSGSPDMVYRIVGYADAGTGTAKINDRLSKERAEAVYNCLVNEFNVPANQLRVESVGGVDNMFYNDPKLSRAVISTAIL